MTFLIFFYIFIFGLIIGSFLNALIYRMHENVSMIGRSFCPGCKTQIAWYDNVPVLSFLMLRGKCRKCHMKISWQYPLVEIITGVLFLLVFIFGLKSLALSQSSFQFSIFNFQNFLTILDSRFVIQLLRDLFFIAVMIVIFIYDLKWYLILDRVTLPAIILIFVINIFLGFNYLDLLLAGLVGGGFFLAQFIISKGRWIGGGDIRLGLLMGMMFSWPMILLALLLAYLIGSVISIFLVAFGKKKWGSEVPLGIFLTSASIITLFWGNQILDWYLNFI